MKIILRPLGKNSWSNVKKYRNCYEDIGSYWTRSGSLYTGLTKDEEDRLGERLGLDLKPGSDFWKSFNIRTSVKDLYLDTADAMDELRYIFLKGHKRVKNSLMENKASANFVLINKDEEAKVSNLQNKVIREAFAAFDKLSATDIRKVLRLYGENADNMSSEVAEKRLFDLIEGNPSRFLERWTNNDSRETEVLLEKSIAGNVIRKNLNIYKYGSDTIGRSKEEAINYLDDPRNQDVKRAILIEIDAKDYINNREVHTEVTSKIQEIMNSEDPEEEVAKPKTKKSDK